MIPQFSAPLKFTCKSCGHQEIQKSDALMLFSICPKCHSEDFTITVEKTTSLFEGFKELLK